MNADLGNGFFLVFLRLVNKGTTLGVFGEMLLLLFRTTFFFVKGVREGRDGNLTPPFLA